MMNDHPFSQYLRILGKGPKSRRPLTEAEASDALSMILAGEVTDKQLGAFLLLMRANGETPSELIGFVKGLRKTLGLVDISSEIDLDWSSYAGKWRYPPYYLLSIKLLVQNGYKICLHGDDGQFANRHYAHAFLDSLGAVKAESLDGARTSIATGQMTYLPLSAYAPQLRDILHLKSELGVRTVFNTAVKLLNPLNAPCAIQGIFHKGVEQLHHATAQAIGTSRNLVFKGEGGEAEVRPDALTQLFISAETLQDEPELVTFQGMIERQIRPKTWEQDDLIRLWRGELQDVYGEGAVIATAASALLLMGSKSGEISMESALATARDFWQARNQKY